MLEWFCRGPPADEPRCGGPCLNPSARGVKRKQPSDSPRHSRVARNHRRPGTRFHRFVETMNEAHGFFSGTSIDRKCRKIRQFLKISASYSQRKTRIFFAGFPKTNDSAALSKSPASRTEFHSSSCCEQLGNFCELPVTNPTSLSFTKHQERIIRLKSAGISAQTHTRHSKVSHSSHARGGNRPEMRVWRALGLLAGAP